MAGAIVSAPAAEARRFLEALWPNPPDAAGILTLWTAPARRPYLEVTDQPGGAS